MLEIKLGLFLLLLQLSTLSYSDDGSSCVDDYLDFEEQTFGNNSENRLKLYQAFYPPNDHLPYSVVVTYQAVLPNGTRVNISTDPSCPDQQVWLWLSSPILLFINPTDLNRLALYTLNHFTEWVPPHLTITTPLPCSAKAEGFLTLMTTSLQAYALGEMSKGEHMGYSRQGCATNIAIPSLKDDNSSVHIYRIISAIGFYSLVIFGSIASVVLLQVLLKALSQKMKACSYSFDDFGMFWGMSAILCPVLMVLLYRAIAHLSFITFNPDHQLPFVYARATRYIWPFVLAFPIIFCAPVAIYFGVKFKLTTPSVYLLPAKLLCCCNEKRAQIVVVSLTLWFNMVAGHYIVGHGVYVLYALPVAPFVVAVNVMLLVLSFMCLTYAMALVFTVCALVGTRKCLRSNADCFATVRAAMLIPLLLAVICFSFSAAFSGQFVNTATQQNSFHVLLKSLFAPVLLAIVSLCLKRFISVWVHCSPGGVEGDNTVYPFHGQEYNRHQALDNVVVE